MIGKTLGFYIFKRFMICVFAVFLSCFALVAIVDFLETMRKIGGIPGVHSGVILLLSMTRVPFFVELILPFAVLIGSIICLVNLSRKLELVVARAAGISAWQFLTPALVGALLIGIFFTTVYNPIAVNLREYGQKLDSQLIQGRKVEAVSTFWIRQQSDDGQAVLQAASGANKGINLLGVTAYRFDADGVFFERIDAQKATLEVGRWKLEMADITPLSGLPRKESLTYLSTVLTADQVRDSFVAPEMVSFSDLPNYIEITKKAGLSATRFELQYHVLLARPLLLVAMVLLAASGSLKFFRLGGLTETIIAGIVIGFLLYIGSELASNFGRSGFVNPVTAGWSPAIIGCLVGLKLILSREDG